MKAAVSALVKTRRRLTSPLLEVVAMPNYVRDTMQKILFARAITIVIYGICVLTPLFLLYWSTQETFLTHGEIMIVFVALLAVSAIMMFLLNIYVKYTLAAPIPCATRSVDTDWMLSAADCRDAQRYKLKPALTAVADVLSAGTNRKAMECFNELNKRLCEHDAKIILRALWAYLIELEPSILQHNIDLRNFISYMSD
jgi:hypothetical protein